MSEFDARGREIVGRMQWMANHNYHQCRCCKQWYNEVDRNDHCPDCAAELAEQPSVEELHR